MVRFIVVFCVGLLLSGCSTSDSKGLLSEFQRGMVIREAGEWVFRPCFSERRQGLKDDNHELLNWFSQAPVAFDQAYAELMVYTDPVDPEFKHIDQVLLLGSQPRACEYELNGNHFRAAGDQPLWIADVRDEGIRVKVRGSLRQLLFPAVEPEQMNSGLIWRSQLDIQAGYQLMLELKRQPCLDQYGTRYPYQARLALNTMHLSGCAREGNLGQRSLMGRYGYEDRRMSLRLDLSVDGKVTLTDVRHDSGGRLASYLTGEWRLLSSGRVLLELSLSSGTKQLLFLERDGNGSLRIKPGRKPYQAGALLQRQEASSLEEAPP